MWPNNIKYNSEWDIFVDGVKIEDTDKTVQSDVFSYAVQSFINDFWKNIPNLLDNWFSKTLNEEHGWCEERRSDWYFRDHEIGAVQMKDVQWWNGFSIEWYNLDEYTKKEQDSLFDYIVDSLKRNEFKRTLLGLLKQDDSDAIEDPDDWIWYNPHEIRD
jgi:hypothetical protein